MLSVLLALHLPQLRATIDASACGELTFLTSEWEKPFTVNSLGNKMRDWCDQAELPHCTLHGLRKAGATIAAENGATDEQLMAIFGWTTKQQTTHYTRKAQHRRMAEHAFHLLVIPEQNQDKIVLPKKARTKSGTQSEKTLTTQHLHKGGGAPSRDRTSTPCGTRF